MNTMNKMTEQEYNDNIKNGMSAHSMKSIKLVLDSLGYEIAPNMGCLYTRKGARLKSVGIREKDTKLSFANVDARRDSNFKALQKFRLWNFGYTNKTIIEL